MSSFNKVQIIGNLGADPESRALPSGEMVSNFSVAATERWKSKAGEQQEHTEWFRVSAFGKLAEICNEYLHKGDSVFIEGKLRTRQYEKDGQKRYSTDVIADRMLMLGGKGDGPKQQKSEDKAPAKKAPAKGGFEDMDDDIPF